MQLAKTKRANHSHLPKLAGRAKVAAVVVVRLVVVRSRREVFD